MKSEDRGACRAGGDGVTDDQEFITDIYRGLLNRDPDETGMRHFGNMLRNGTLDRIGLITAVLSSTEFTSRKPIRPGNLGNEPRGCGRSEAEAVFSRFRKYEGLIHCDIQGAEANLFADTIELVSTKVKRIVIGTHSFEIDRRLSCLFSKHGWDLEGINVCEMMEDKERLVVALDGVQVWRNASF